MKRQLAVLTGILAGVLLITSPHVVFADQGAIVGQVVTDKLVYDLSQDSTATVVYHAENQTDSLWSPELSGPYATTYAYEIYSSTGGGPVNGNLQPTIAQYVAGGSRMYLRSAR